jgi:hypothetical protein
LEQAKGTKYLNVSVRITGFLSFRLQIASWRCQPRYGGIDMFPKARLDALHDGIFSVAMTLLVLDVRLPEEFHPRDGTELWRLSSISGRVFAVPAELHRARPSLARQHRGSQPGRVLQARLR